MSYPVPTKSEKKPNKWIIIGAVVLVLAAIGAIFGGNKDDAPTAASPTATTSGTTSRALLSETTTTTAKPAKPKPAKATATPTAEVEPITEVQVPDPTSAVEPVSIPMPDVVCMNLQAAQDLIQKSGVFFSKSVDATGASRNQINDSNWIVVDQTPAVGELFGEGDAILSVVKTDEPNPC